MNDRIQNMVLKGISAVIIVIGVVFTIIVMGQRDPDNTPREVYEQIAYKEANTKDLSKSMTQIELDQWVNDHITETMKTEREELNNSVYSILQFTKWILILTVIAIVLAFVWGYFTNPKAAIMASAGIVGMLVFLYIVYSTSGDVVPQELVDAEALKVEDEEARVFIPENWKLAGGALTSTLILITVAAVAWVGGEVAKMFK